MIHSIWSDWSPPYQLVTGRGEGVRPGLPEGCMPEPPPAPGEALILLQPSEHAVPGTSWGTAFALSRLRANGH